MKTMTNIKEAYTYILVGLKMSGNIFSEIQPSTGITMPYFDMIYGCKHIKIKIKEQMINLHIILVKKNQMAHNLMLLLHQTNLDLIKRK